MLKAISFDEHMGPSNNPLLLRMTLTQYLVKSYLLKQIQNKDL